MDVLGDFLSQLPVGLILWPILAFLALVVSVVMLLRARRIGEPGRQRRRSSSTPHLNLWLSGEGYVAEDVVMVDEKPDDEVLPEPDLDALIGGEGELIEGDELQEASLGLPGQGVLDSGEAPDVIEVLRVWRDLADGSMIIEMDGSYYRRVHEISDPGLYRRLLSILRELARQAREIEILGGHEAMRAREPEPADPVVVGFHAFARRKPPSPKIESVVAQIEAFLQYKLQHSKFSARSIHIRETIGGGVMIEVDGHIYEGVGDVVDPDVREFLQRTIREWEARQ